MKELFQQSVIVVVFGGAVGIFSGFFMSMSEQSNQTHQIVQEVKIRQETDRQIIIDSIAELETKIDSINQPMAGFGGVDPNMEYAVPQEEDVWNDLEKNRSRMQQRFSPQQSLKIP